MVSVRAFGGNLKIMYGIYKLIAKHIKMLSIDDFEDSLPSALCLTSEGPHLNQTCIEENDAINLGAQDSIKTYRGSFPGLS